MTQNEKQDLGKIKNLKRIIKLQLKSKWVFHWVKGENDQSP